MTLYIRMYIQYICEFLAIVTTYIRIMSSLCLFPTVHLIALIAVSIVALVAVVLAVILLTVLCIRKCCICKTRYTIQRRMTKDVIKVSEELVSGFHVVH